MIIGIDASRTAVARRTGTEAYSLELTRALLDLQTDHQWRLYFRDEPPPDLFEKPAFLKKAGFYETRLITPRKLWTHIGLSRELMRTPPQRLFVPAHVLPAYHPCPSIVTIHDLGYIHFPQSHPFKQRLYLDLSTRFSAKFATHLLADSEATRHDLISFYNTPAEKITVVYPGYDESLKPVRHPNQKAIVADKYKLPQKFLLHVGT
ncbi:MAG: glycosyltransferase, partial [Chloroflexi bacterium]|nr:glycosyltransferase [Chloroflexota bacterium]